MHLLVGEVEKCARHEQDPAAWDVEPGHRAWLTRLAILCGHGAIGWPDLDPNTRARATRLADHGRRCTDLIAAAPGAYPDAWATNGTLDPVHVWTLWPAARVHGVASGGAAMRRKLATAGAQPLHQQLAANKYAARVAKADILAAVQEHRCLPPASLVPLGRTQTWRQTGGPSVAVDEP